MKILYLQENELEAVGPVLPEGILSGVVFVLAAVEEDTVMGVAVVQKLSGKQMALKWLYVPEKFRRQGVANALLDFILDEIKREENACLTLEYPIDNAPADKQPAAVNKEEAEQDYSMIFNHMLIKREAQLTSSLLRLGMIDRAGLYASKLAELTFADEEMGDLYSFEELPGEVLQAFVKDKHLTAFSTEDLLSADKLLSVVYGVDGNMAGYILVAEDDTEGREKGDYIITGIYLDDKYRSHFVNFLGQAFKYLLWTDDLIKRLSFVVYEDRVYALINKLLGDNVEWTEQEIIRGIVG